jgi:hypothetical protein
MKPFQGKKMDKQLSPKLIYISKSPILQRRDIHSKRGLLFGKIIQFKHYCEVIDIIERPFIINSLKGNDRSARGNAPGSQIISIKP